MRDITIIYRVLGSLEQLLQGTKVKWFSDITNVIHIVQKGSMKSNLQDVTLNICELIIKKCISLGIGWIPRDRNEFEDYLSKIIDVDDWDVSKQLFTGLNSKWSSHDVDWVA